MATGSTSPNLEYVEINYNMSKEQIRDMLGQPDDIHILRPGREAPIWAFDEDDHSTRREVWNYGPFGAYRQDYGYTGHYTRYRLQVMFVGDKVVE
jgi:hypothetical protein